MLVFVRTSSQFLFLSVAVLYRSLCAGMDPRGVLSHATHIMHGPRPPPPGFSVPRPLSACSMGTADSVLAHAEQQHAVRACAQWATNADAVLQRVPVEHGVGAEGGQQAGMDDAGTHKEQKGAMRGGRETRCLGGECGGCL